MLAQYYACTGFTVLEYRRDRASFSEDGDTGCWAMPPTRTCSRSSAGRSGGGGGGGGRGVSIGCVRKSLVGLPPLHCQLVVLKR